MAGAAIVLILLICLVLYCRGRGLSASSGQGGGGDRPVHIQAAYISEHASELLDSQIELALAVPAPYSYGPGETNGPQNLTKYDSPYEYNNYPHAVELASAPPIFTRVTNPQPSSSSSSSSSSRGVSPSAPLPTHSNARSSGGSRHGLNREMSDADFYEADLGGIVIANMVGGGGGGESKGEEYQV
jgi:hypothetical protein